MKKKNGGKTMNKPCRYSPLVAIVKILEDKQTIHRLNELGVVVGDQVYHLYNNYYKTLGSSPIIFRAKLITK